MAKKENRGRPLKYDIPEEFTVMQMKAVNNLLRGMSKREAMLDAGYTPASASSSYKFFNLPHIKNYVEQRMRNMVSRNTLSEDWIVNRLMAIAGANPGDMLEVDEEGLPKVNWNKMTPEIRAAIGGLEQHDYLEGRGPQAKPVRKLKIKERDALRAIELLGKYLGMFSDKMEVSGEMSLVERLQRGRERVGKTENEEDE